MSVVHAICAMAVSAAGFRPPVCYTTLRKVVRIGEMLR
ncbi:hypothetical protein SAMN04515678_101516 [Roseivivax sediminis]|uniref:Uncharacterized protein n=1 Tax=Roseivivax sediminis TaxID=936889 RepID=A0A1I1T7F6_9RHOB|nr:hypothetical protein SAMN04515678_101516 [Roseivivax sediminis]